MIGVPIRRGNLDRATYRGKTIRAHKEQAAVCKPGLPSLRTKSASTLILNFGYFVIAVQMSNSQASPTSPVWEFMKRIKQLNLSQY